MKNRNIIVTAVVVSLLLFLGVVLYQNNGMNTDYRDEVEYVIGVSQANMREEWRVALIQEIQAEAGKDRHIRIITTDATDTVEKQEQDIDHLLDYGVDLLIVSPCDTAELTGKVASVYQEGTPVIVMDRSVEGFDYNLFIGPDNVLIGKQAGECVLDLLPDQAGEVLEICSEEPSVQGQERRRGFESVLREYPGIEKKECYVKREMKDQAYDLVTAIKADLGNIDVIFAANDYVALGAYEALSVLGMEKDIKIIGSNGYTGENEGTDLVQKEEIAATISCPTGGREAIQYAMMILKKESGVPKQVILRSHTITKENAQEYLQTLNQEWEDDGRRITVGYSQVGQESAWRMANTKSIQEAAQNFNIKLVFEDANQSQEKQIAAIRSFIKQEVDVIVVSPVVENGWDEVLEEVKQAGIPIIMSDRKIDTQEDLATAYIGADLLEEGRRAMRWIRDNIKPDKERMKIMELKGNKEAAPTIERKAGFEEVLAECPKYEITYSEYGDFTFQGGKKLVAEYLQKYRWDIDIIYCHNDDMALGAIEALEANGIKPGEDVKIVSVDGTKAAFQAMTEGKLNCLVECNPLLGPPLMKAIRDMVAGKEMPLRIITEEKVYDETTAMEEIRSRVY